MSAESAKIKFSFKLQFQMRILHNNIRFFAVLLFLHFKDSFGTKGAEAKRHIFYSHLFFFYPVITSKMKLLQLNLQNNCLYCYKTPLTINGEKKQRIKIVKSSSGQVIWLWMTNKRPTVHPQDTVAIRRHLQELLDSISIVNLIHHLLYEVYISA